MTPVWFLVCALALTPQIFLWRSQSPFLLTKALYVYLVGAFACLLLALARRRDRPRIGFPRALLAPAIFVGYAAARAPWFADSRAEIASPFLWGAVLLVAWPTAAALEAAPDRGARLAQILTGLGALTAAFAILQFAGIDVLVKRHDRTVLSATFFFGAGRPPFATLGNPNFLGEYLAGVLPLAVTGALAAPGRRRWLTGGAAALMAAALPLTLARGPWLGALIGVGAALWALRPGWKVAGRGLLWMGLALAASGLAATAVMEGWGRGGPWMKLAGTVSEWRGGTGRVIWWGAALRIVADRPWAGVGEGRFREAYPPYQAQILRARQDPADFTVAASPVESPHNDYLQVAAELGLPGALLLLAALGLILADAAHAVRADPGPTRGWRAGSLGGIAAIAVAGLFGYPLHTATGLYLASTLAALAVAARPGDDRPAPAPPWQWLLLAAVTALGLYQTANLLRVYAASVHLHRGIEALVQGDVEAAIVALERAHEVDPRDSHVRATLGHADLAAGRPDLALPHLEAGLHGFDSATLRTTLGRTYMALGLVGAAEETFRVGVDSFPGYAPLHANYGAFLASRGRSADAARELERALSHDPNLADAHYWMGNLRLRQGDPAGAAAALQRFLELAVAGDPRVARAAAQLRELRDAPGRVDNGEKPGK